MKNHEGTYQIIHLGHLCNWYYCMIVLSRYLQFLYDLSLQKEKPNAVWVLLDKLN